MKRVVSVLTLGLLLALALTACPGLQTAKNVSVTATGADAAAYRVEDGDWQVPDDVQNFSFAATGPYEVAVRCGDHVNVFAFTTSDLVQLPVLCEDAGQGVSFSVAYDASAVTGVNRVALYYPGGMRFSNPGQTSGTFSITGGKEGTQDLVLVAYDNNGDMLAARMLTTDVSDGGSYTVTMEAGDTGHLKPGGSVADFSGQMPSGWSVSHVLVAAVTPNGTPVYVSFMDASGGDYTSLDFAHHDVVVAGASDVSPNPTKRVMELQIADATAHDFSVTLPAVFDANISHEALPTFSGLSRSDADLVGYHLQVSWGCDQQVSALVSKGFLGSATSYALPDLTSVSGFAGMKPASGDTAKANAEAIQSNLSWSEVAQGDGLGGQPLRTTGLDVRVATDIERYTVP